MSADKDDEAAAEAFAEAVDRTEGRLDAAVLAYRADPTPENEAAVFAAMREHNDAFERDQTIEFQTRAH